VRDALGVGVLDKFGNAEVQHVSILYPLGCALERSLVPLSFFPISTPKKTHTAAATTYNVHLVDSS
jgi:hypothetical protein